MSTSNTYALATQASYGYKNHIWPQILEILTTLRYDFIWLQAFDLLSLVSMGTHPNDIPLFDTIINSFNNENLTIIMIVHGKPILFSVKPSCLHRLIGLS